MLAHNTRPLPGPAAGLRPLLEFDLDGDYVELKQLLKLADLVTSGGEAKMVISEGQVRVDGEVELRKACKIRAGQVVEFADSQIRVLAAG